MPGGALRLGHPRRELPLLDDERCHHAEGSVVRDAAPEAIGARPERQLLVGDVARLRHRPHVEMPAAATLEDEVVRVLAGVPELDDRVSRLDRRPRQPKAVLLRDDLHARGRRRGEHHATRVVRWKADAFGITCAASTPSHCSRSDAYTPRKSAVAFTLPSSSRPFLRPGNSPTICPFTRVPIRKPTPAAPWSVPASPFSCARRPNSDHTCTRTRSARPRDSRSRWNASSESAVSCRPDARSFAWFECVS